MKTLCAVALVTLCVDAHASDQAAKIPARLLPEKFYLNKRVSKSSQPGISIVVNKSMGQVLAKGHPSYDAVLAILSDPDKQWDFVVPDQKVLLAIQPAWTMDSWSIKITCDGIRNAIFASYRLAKDDNEFAGLPSGYEEKSEIPRDAAIQKIRFDHPERDVSDLREVGAFVEPNKSEFSGRGYKYVTVFGQIPCLGLVADDYRDPTPHAK